MGFRDPSIEFDIADDWLVWDKRLKVTYTSVRSSGDRRSHLVEAVRRGVSRKQAQLSRGVYTQDDVNWSIPVAELPQGIEPKPRDTILDPDGLLWTCITARRIGWRETWILTCRALRIVADLQQTITFEQPNYSRDSTGLRKTSWSTVSTCYGRLQPVTAAIAEERGLRGLKVTHTAYLESEVIPSNEWRISVDGVKYEIRGYRSTENIETLMQVDVELVP